MKKQTALASVAIGALAISTVSAFAAEGLTQIVWHGVPYIDFVPTAADITTEQTWAAVNAPTYTFVNTVDSFDYANSNTPWNSGVSTIAAFFGAVSASAALADTTPPNSTDPNGGYFAFDAKGYIDVSTAGSYTFSLGNTYNLIDDAARVTVDGQIVAQQNFASNLTPFETTETLTAGYHSFDLFYFQTLYGYGLDLTATGPNGAIDYTTSIPEGALPPVPEPTTWAMLTLGFAGLGFAVWRKGRSARAIVA